jgi:hypothetical protein
MIFVIVTQMNYFIMKKHFLKCFIALLFKKIYWSMTPEPKHQFSAAW